MRLPRESDREDLPTANAGEPPARVWRVTVRTITERTDLRLAPDADAAIDDQASQVVQHLGRQGWTEIVECVEYIPGGTRYLTTPTPIDRGDG